MNGEPKRVCHLCGQPTDTFVREYETRPNFSNHRFFERKIPLCMQCFKEIQPTKENKQRVAWYVHIFPIVEEETVP